MVTGTTAFIVLDTALQQVLTPEQAWHYRIIPRQSGDSMVHFYIDEEKQNNQVAEELEMLFGKQVELCALPVDVIEKNLAKYYRKNDRAKNRTEVKINKDEDFLITLIRDAKQVGSSDIHIESYEEKCRVRLRIDGHLVEKYLIQRSDYPALINKIKIKANLDIAEKRLPQDGRIYFEDHNEKFDIRVSVLPALYGEKVVMRLLNKDATDIDIHNLGFNEMELGYYLEGISKPHGIILISGPTGSGKTTTLYATLKILNKEKNNIITIEDPIEYTLDGINQVQLKENIGLTFAQALRTFLRQDPDIIMVGEIRDAETANIAIRASLTGHLVLSTIHTNSAWGTVSRLADMGVPPYLLAGTLSLTVAQRLVRLLCPNCKKEEVFSASLLPAGTKVPMPLEKHYKAVGCNHCYHTGYKGRKAIYEVIPITPELSEQIRNNDLHIDEFVKEKNIRLLRDNAFELFSRGETSLEEIYPVLLNSK
ncbi:MAG: GspE/PulE family protein [Bacteroidia bacterium]